MCQVFLSYAHEDKARARLLKEVLEKKFSIWWDENLLPGQKWMGEIQSALARSRCVVVLWTPHSVGSEQVTAEANFALNENKIVSVLLETAAVFVPFTARQYADLRDWDGQEDHPAIRDLVKGVDACVKGEQVSNPPGDKLDIVRVPIRKAPSWRKPIVAWLAVSFLLLVLSVVALIGWPSTVAIETVTNRVSFHTRSEAEQVLLEPVRATSLALAGFENVRLSPVEVRLSDPKNVALSSFHGDLALRPADAELATITIRSTRETEATFALDPISTSEAEVTFESPQQNLLSVNLRGMKQPSNIALPREFMLAAAHCIVEGGPQPLSMQSVSLRIRLSDNNRLLHVSPGKLWMLIQIGVPPGEGTFLPKSGLVVDRVEFRSQAPTGEPESTIDGPGGIHYEGLPGVEPVTLRKGDILILEDLRNFRLLEAAMLGNEKALRLRWQGVVGKLSSGPPGSVRDRRLTWLEMLRGNRSVATLVTGLTSLAGLVVILRKLYLGWYRKEANL